MRSAKLKSRRQMVRIARRLARQGKRIVFTNGCFDILHAGHVRYLEQARRSGDCLVVGLNSDRSTRGLKGPGRPVNPEQDRAAVLAGLSSVDYIVVFGEGTPRDLICDLHPHVLVKGADYAAGQIAGAKEVVRWGGRVRRVPFLRGRSTSRIINAIKI